MPWDSTPWADANKSIKNQEGLSLPPTSPFLLFSLCTLSSSLALAVTAWIGSRSLLFISLFSPSPNTPGPWLGARAAPRPWQSWGCEFSIQRAESLNPLLGDGWIIRNFICWAGNKQLCIFCCFADVSWGNSDAAPKLQGWVFFLAGMAPCSVLWESPVMLGRALPGISAGAGVLLVLWDVRSQCRSLCSLSSVPPQHSRGPEQHLCLKGGKMPHVWCFSWDFVACVGFSLPEGVERHFLGWRCFQRAHLRRDVLGIWQAAPGHSCCSESQPSGFSPAWGLGTGMVGVWGIRNRLCQSPVPAPRRGLCRSSEQ